MKIIVIHNIKTSNEEFILEAFLAQLSSGFHISQLHISNLDDDTKENTLNTDIIFYFNCLSQINKRKHINNIVILVISATRWFELYPKDLSLYENIILIDNEKRNNFFVENKSLIFRMGYPIKKMKIQNKTILKENNKVILIAFEEQNSNELYIRIASIINSLIPFRIKIIVNKKDFPCSIFNDTVICCDKHEFGKLINTADLVIANKTFALQALLTQKPLIVLGTRGIGCLVKPSTVKYHYEHFFNGRIGGEIGEYIPSKILLNEILDSLEMKQDELNTLVLSNYKWLQETKKIQSEELLHFINKTVSNYNIIAKPHNILEAYLFISPVFSLVPIKEGKYMVINNITNCYHSTIEKEEAEILHFFRERNNVSSVMFKSGYNEAQNNFIDFIADLIKEKILLISSEKHDKIIMNA